MKSRYAFILGCAVGLAVGITLWLLFPRIVTVNTRIPFF